MYYYHVVGEGILVLKHPMTDMALKGRCRGMQSLNVTHCVALAGEILKTEEATPGTFPVSWVDLDQVLAA